MFGKRANRTIFRQLWLPVFVVILGSASVLCQSINEGGGGQQEEKFFYDADFPEDQDAEASSSNIEIVERSRFGLTLPQHRLQDSQSQHSEKVSRLHQKPQEWQMTTMMPTDHYGETVYPTRPGKNNLSNRPRRPGRRRRKRPQVLPSTLNDGEVLLETTMATPLRGNPSFEYRVSEDEADPRLKQRRAQKIQGQHQAPANYKALRRPYAIMKADAQGAEDSSGEATKTDLKSLLKHASGSLSLSEILQQKNLSLADLLSKKHSAISALKHTEATTMPSLVELNSGEMMMTGEDDEDAKKHRRIPPMFVAMPPHIYPTEEVRTRPNPSDVPTIASDLPHKRFNAQSENYKPIKEVVSRIRPDFGNTKKKRPVSSESAATPTTTTIRPRWKPPMEGRTRTRNEYIRNPGIITTSQQPDLVTDEKVVNVETTALPPNYLSSPASTNFFENLKNYQSREVFNDNRNSEERLNNAIEKEGESKGKEVVKLEDLFRFSMRPNSETRKTNRIEADLIEKVIQNTQRALIESAQTRGSVKVDVTERNPGLFMDITSERAVDDRTDILELLGDRRGGAKLAKILEQRNMTLEELIDHRKRGSSRLHLLEILNNRFFADRQGKSKNPDHNLDIVTAFDNFPQFSFANLRSVRPDEVKTDSQGSSYFASVINVRPTEEKPRFRNKHNFDRLVNSDRNRMSGSPLSRLSAAAQEPSNFIEMTDFEPMSMKPLEVDDGTQIPMGVRSAILASTSIVIVSVFIFIIIFIACRWRQKRTRKLQYVESFRGRRGRLPILDREASCSKRSSSPIVYQTSISNASSGPPARLSKLHSVDPHSSLELPDYLFESMKSY